MIVVLLIPTVLGVGVWSLVRVAHTTGPAWRARGYDGAWGLVMLASSWIPEGDTGWRAAMRAEFESVEGRGKRWRFALGCLRTALLVPRHVEPRGRAVAGAVIIALGMCTALQVYGWVRYPTGIAGGIGYGALFLLFSVGGAWMALFGFRSAGPEARVDHRYGIVGGVAVGVLYVVAATPSSHAGYGGYAALLGVAVAVAAGTMATRASGDHRAGVRAGVWVGLTSGLVFFIGLMTLTYAAAGWWTYDREAVSVFNGFGPVTQHGHSLSQWPGFAAFVVRRESSVALLVGFILAPLLAVAAGEMGTHSHGNEIRPSHAAPASPFNFETFQPYLLILQAISDRRSEPASHRKPPRPCMSNGWDGKSAGSGPCLNSMF